MESTRNAGGSMMKKPWFPPATFQLRVRSLSSLVVLNPPPHKGPFQLEIRDASGCSLWSSSEFSLPEESSTALISILEGSLSHPDESFSVILLAVEEQSNILKEWSVPRLGDLSVHGPLIPENIPLHKEPSLLLGICGSSLYLSLESSPEEGPTKALTFPAPYIVPSYSLSLLLKYRRHTRALQQREADNQNLKLELADQGLDIYNTRITDPDSSLSLHQRIFTSNPSKKSPFERKSELLIASKMEYLRCQLDLLRSEKERLRMKNDAVKKDISQLHEDIQQKKKVIERLSRDTESLKTSLSAWSRECQQSLKDFQVLDSHIKETRLHLVNSIKDLFPISVEGNVPTIRWVSLPNLSSLSRSFLKQDTLNVVSIVLGWIAHIVLLMSRCLDIPLRYPIKTSGSIFSIRNNVCKIQEEDLREFPLTARSVDLNRCEYGIYLLNKNVCYLRWSCGLPSGDVRKILHNVLDLYNLGLKTAFKSLKGAELDLLALQRPTKPPWMNKNKCIPSNSNINVNSVHRDS